MQRYASRHRVLPPSIWTAVMVLVIAVVPLCDRSCETFVIVTTCHASN